MPTVTDCVPMTRRQFLRRTASAAAAPLILSAGARGANDRIALGVIGTGKRGTGDMRTFLRLDGVEVVAVCDAVEERREDAQVIVAKSRGDATQNGCKAYSDFREILARDDIDAVLLAPQDHWHGVMAVRAAESGKDMYCEKPLGVAVRECQAIRDAVRRHGVVFQTGTQQRSDAKFRLACELARNGYLGDVHTVKVAAPGPSYQRGYEDPTTPQPVPPGLDYEMYVGPAQMKPYNAGRLAWPDWYLIWDYCAGFIVNWGVHHLDIALWGCPQLGEQPFELTCTADYRNDGLCDNVNAWQAEFAYPDGLQLSYSDTGHPHEQGCRFEGDEGWVHVNRQGIKAQPESLLDVSLRPEDLRLHESTDHTADFINSVRTRRDPVAPVEAGHMASTLGMLADIAARVQRKLRWDPAAERFIDDDEANRLLARPLRAPWVL
jgi:predicted dehydrogenase